MNVNPYRGFVANEFSLFFKKFDLQPLKFFNKFKGVFTIHISIK